MSFTNSLMTAKSATLTTFFFLVLQFPEAQEFSFPNLLQPAGGAGVRFSKPADMFPNSSGSPLALNISKTDETDDTARSRNWRIKSRELGIALGMDILTFQ